ncbi:MAG: DUF2284 domain-containing protein [Actinomycetota bacterium]|nr:DUF2284 domain-containing protein [Actinomycetota bacterium]
MEKFCRAAIKLGAVEAKPIKADDVIVSDWVRRKCQYGCGGYGQCLTCPPYSPTPDQMRKILSEYKWAILLRFEPEGPNVRETTVKLERRIFLSGYYSAFGLGAGPCHLCDKCNLKECIHPDLARPSMEACGVDVYATVRKAGFKIEVLKDQKQRPVYFGLLLVK